MLLEGTKAANQKCSVKKVFLEISQTSQGNTCAGVFFFNKFAKNENFQEISNTILSSEHLRWLLLEVVFSSVCYEVPIG